MKLDIQTDATYRRYNVRRRPPSDGSRVVTEVGFIQCDTDGLGEELCFYPSNFSKLTDDELGQITEAIQTLPTL